MWLSKYLGTSGKAGIENDIESQSFLVKPQQKLLEDFPPGYSRYAAFLGAHDKFQIYRRFSNLRTRILLAKQDRLSILETKLETIDRKEDSPLFRGSMRLDRNAERQEILIEIEQVLCSYDECLMRDSRIFQLKDANRRDASSVRNWLSGTSHIALKETQYLVHTDDLLTLSSPVDSTLHSLEIWVEDKLVRYSSGLYKSDCKNISCDENIFIPSGSLVANLARTLLGCLAVILLLGPILACNFLESDFLRLVVVLVATIIFLAIVLGITEAKAMEVFVTGSAYATVLTVFITQGGPQNA